MFRRQTPGDQLRRIPGAEATRALVEKTPARNVYLPFRFGDIQLYVCEKIAEAEVNEGTEARGKSKP